jgi:hypothetical protein
MRDFLFPDGKIWVLEGSGELAIANLGQGSVALLLFSDEYLASAFALDGGLAGKTAKLIHGGKSLVNILRQSRERGVTHVGVDATFGKGTHVLMIDKAIEQIEKGRPPEGEVPDASGAILERWEGIARRKGEP